MADVVVTVPMRLWAEWLDEGDRAYAIGDVVVRCEACGQVGAPGTPVDEVPCNCTAFYNGAAAGAPAPLQPAEWGCYMEYGFNLATRHRPKISPGERVYIVAHGLLRGYAPLHKIESAPVRFGGRRDGFALVRRGGAVAVTIDQEIRGFQGWRYRWWEREFERPFPGYRTEGVRG